MRAGTRVRVLHVVATLGQGGVETWLCNLLPRFDKSKFQFDICFYRRTREELKERFLSAACRVIEIPLKDDIGVLERFVGDLRQLIRCGEYEAVHCHGMSFIGVALYCAWRERVPIRIAHSHGTSEPARPVTQRTFLALARYAAQRLATHTVGCCTEAAEALFGQGCLRKGASVLYCGVDLEKGTPGVPPGLKESLGIPLSATTIGCVANFTPAKNHSFLLAVFEGILRHDTEAHLVLVGDGQYKDEIEKKAAELGILERIHLLGCRNDVPALLSIFNVFILPSLTEGLPVSLLEAQAHSVACVTSTAVTREAEVIPGLVKFLPLTADLDLWARTAIAMARSDSKQSADGSRVAFQRSPYNIDCGVSRLTQIYLS